VRLLKGAEILTMAGRNIQNGYVLIDGSKIVEVGEGRPSPLPNEVEMVDLSGKTVMPGMVDPHCHIGVFPEEVGTEHADANEMTSPTTASVRALDAIHPQDPAFAESLAAGYTTVLVVPGSGNVVGGLGCVIKTHGQVVDDMVIDDLAGLKMAFGGNPKNDFPGKAKNHPVTRMGVAATLRELLFKGQEYIRKQESDDGEYDADLEVVAKVLKREVVARIHVARDDDILTVIRIAREFDLRFTMEHVMDGHLIASHISESGAPCVVGPLFSPRGASETRNMSFETPGALARAGVKVALTCDHPIVPLKYGTYQAVYAVRAGMDRDEALKALTINAAEIAGVGERVGSIEPGKDADLVVLDAHPLNLNSNVEQVYIDGKVVWKQC